MKAGATMNLAVYSDLHLEFSDWTPPPRPADVVLLAGDIHVDDAAFAWARRHFPDTTVIYVAGNHEFFGSDMPAALARMQAAARRHGIHFLHDGEHVERGVRFLGTTLWTDFELYGGAPEQIERSMRHARRGMHDYRQIEHRPGEALSPELTRELHLRQRGWLKARLAEPFDGSTVVVTHHLPHPGSVHARYDGDALNPAFASDLGALFGANVQLWAHGHTHESCDYRVGATRVICNPRGYIPQLPNPAFDPELRVSIP